MGHVLFKDFFAFLCIFLLLVRFLDSSIPGVLIPGIFKL
jgi:hypothetical protein